MTRVCFVVAVLSLRSLLLTDDNEVLLGNICLCLSHCVHEPPVSESLDKDCIKKLLVLVREADSGAVKQNGAILIGKLVKANPRSVLQIRRMVTSTYYIVLVC